MPAYQLPVWIWPTALMLVCGLALWRGRDDERLAAAGNLANWAITLVVFKSYSAETQWYVEHALDRGLVSTTDFTRDAVQLLARITNGVPRQINRLCRAVMLAANAEHRSEIDAELVLSIAEELLDYQAA